jgi:hypothetical protein
MYHSAGSTEQSWVSVDWAVATFGPSRLLYFLYPNARGFRPDLPLGSGLFIYPPSDTDSDKQTPPLERQTVRLNGRMRGLVVDTYVEQRTGDLQSAVVMDET